MNNSGSSWNPVRVVQALLALNTAVWLTFGLISLLRLSLQNPEQIWVFGIVAMLMFGNAAALLLAAWLLGRRPKWGYVFALAVLLVNIVLTFTDQFGLFDLLTLLLDLVSLSILAVKRRDFLRPAGMVDVM